MSACAADLLADLDACPDAAAREALLASASDPALLSELAAALQYRRMNAEIRAELAVEAAQHAAFTSELNAAPDSAARLAIIAAARRGDSRFVDEWVFRRTASPADKSARYFALLKAPEPAPEVGP